MELICSVRGAPADWLGVVTRGTGRICAVSIDGANGGTLTVADDFGPMAGETVGVTPTGAAEIDDADAVGLKWVCTTSANTAFIFRLLFSNSSIVC